MEEFIWLMIELQALFLWTIMTEIHHADLLCVYSIIVGKMKDWYLSVRNFSRPKSA